MIGSGGAAPHDARAYLSATAAEVARRLSFLEEPLAVWELDGGERMAQLRILAATARGRHGDLLGGDAVGRRQPGARAVRYQWSPGMAEREVLTYPATFALIARMADGLAAALQGDAE